MQGTSLLSTKNSFHESRLPPRGLKKNCYYVSHQVMSLFRETRRVRRDERGTGECRGCEGEKTGRRDEREGERVMSCFTSSGSSVFV